MDALLELFSFEGRANRMWYFWHIMLDDAVMIGLSVILMVIGTLLETPLLFLPALGVFLAGFWAGCAMTVKRLHDLDRPGWHWWLLWVPFYNIYLGVVLLLGKGTAGPNRFGRDPLEVSAASGYIER